MSEAPLTHLTECINQMGLESQPTHKIVIIHYYYLKQSVDGFVGKLTL